MQSSLLNLIWIISIKGKSYNSILDCYQDISSLTMAITEAMQITQNLHPEEYIKITLYFRVYWHSYAKIAL